MLVLQNHLWGSCTVPTCDNTCARGNSCEIKSRAATRAELRLAEGLLCPDRASCSRALHARTAPLCSNAIICSSVYIILCSALIAISFLQILFIPQSHVFPLSEQLVRRDDWICDYKTAGICKSVDSAFLCLSEPGSSRLDVLELNCVILFPSWTFPL